MLGPSERSATLASILAAQLPDGTIPWTTDRRWDPWDHVECAMALDAGGAHDEARAAFEMMARTQRHDGAWACPIVGGDETELVCDSNGASYIATGVWHHHLATRDTGALHALWPVVERAIDFTLDLQTPEGPILWARDPGGHPGDHAVLAGSSCIVMSLRCALDVAHALGEERPDWELSLASLIAAIERGDVGFADRSRYSMDWYYPVLSGALAGEPARSRIGQRWDEFVVPGLGARCVADRDWITSAETAELVIALAVCGMHDQGRELLEWVSYLRDDDGAYWTGATFPDGRHFPNERTNWSAAAILLADSVLEGASPTAELFEGSVPTAVPAGS